MGRSGAQYVLSTDSRVSPTSLPADHGYHAWTQPIQYLTSGVIMPTSGLLMLRRIRRVPAGSVGTITTYVTSGGGTLTSGQCFAALYKADGTLVGVSNDQAVAWASGGLKPMTLTGGPFTITAGDYYIGTWFVGTTGPTFIRSGTVNLALTNAGLAAPNLEGASANGSLSNAASAPNPFGTQTSVVYEWWFALS